MRTADILLMASQDIMTGQGIGIVGDGGLVMAMAIMTGRGTDLDIRLEREAIK